jgi:hypothetical protein
MACNTTLTDILKGCDNNIGGLTHFYVLPTEFVASPSNITDNGQGTITGITIQSGTTFAEYQFNKNTANYTEEGTIDLANGSTFYVQTVNLTIPRREAAKRQSLALIAAGQRDLYIIVRDANGLYWFVGRSNGANLTATGDGSGTAKADGSKYTLTFVAEEPEQMFEIDPTIIAGLL